MTSPGKCRGSRRRRFPTSSLRVQQTARLDIVLEVGELSETTEVIGRAPLLQSEEASIGNCHRSTPRGGIAAEWGCGSWQLAFRARSVVSQAGPGQPDPRPIAGHLTETQRFPSAEIAKTPKSSSWMAPSIPIATTTCLPWAELRRGQEFKVEVNSYAAEFGGQGGGQINIITKSGTNSFHGSGLEILRDAKLDAKNFFDPGETNLSRH